MEAPRSDNKSQKTGLSVTYTLFLYREELRRRNARSLRLSKTKIHLTDELISRTVRNINDCTNEVLRDLSREMVFKKKLKHQVQSMRKMQRTGNGNTMQKSS